MFPLDYILNACVQKVDEAIYELESPAQAGNLNSTPEYTLSMIEKAINNATDFATIFNLYLASVATWRTRPCRQVCKRAPPVAHQRGH